MDGVIQLSELCESYPEIDQKVLLDLYAALVPEGGGLDERQYEYMKNMIATML